jgi:hypothetical protein
MNCLRYLPVAALLLLCPFLSAQEPFWTQNFSGGLPEGWQTVDASGQGVVWSWCAGPTAACAPVFGDNQPFQSTSAANGFMTVNSDAAGDLVQVHVSRLTTAPIDCYDREQVFVRFETQIGVYQWPAESCALLRVSTDQVNWTNFTVFPGLTTLNAWSKNPEMPVIDISSVAAGQPAVYLQWEWTGVYEYTWYVDDVALFAENPTRHHDLAVSRFFYPASSFATPVSQIAADTFGFSAQLQNNGQKSQTNVMLTAWVETTAGVRLFADSLLIPELAAGTTDTLFALQGLYVPDLPVGDYRVRYAVRSDSTDQWPVDNVAGAGFSVTENLFAKENGPEFALRPADPGDWQVGNLYTMRAGALDQFKAVQAEFAFATDPDDLSSASVAASVYLLRVNDDVAADWSNFEAFEFLSPSLTWEGVGYYSATGPVADYALQSVPLLTPDGEEEGVALQAGARYLLMVAYEGANQLVYHAFNDDVRTDFVSTVLFQNEWYLGGFEGGSNNAVARLYIALATTADHEPLPETALRVFPNPAAGHVNLDVKFANPTDATVTIADLGGRVINVQDYANLQEAELRFDLEHLAPGAYLARIATAEGTLTRKFVKM